MIALVKNGVEYAAPYSGPPDVDKAVALSWPANEGTGVAPGDGWITGYRNGQSGQYLLMELRSSANIALVGWKGVLSTGEAIRVSIPVSAGDKFLTRWSTSGAAGSLYFVPARTAP